MSTMTPIAIVIRYPTADVKTACYELPRIGSWWNGYRVKAIKDVGGTHHVEVVTPAQYERL